MKFRLLPARVEFYDFFHQAAENNHQAALTLVKMADDLDHSESIAGEIRHLEHRGDDITHRTIQMLNKTFVTPIDREDIHSLISAMDDVADYTEAVSERLWLYKLKGSNPALKQLARILEASTSLVLKVMKGLKDPRQRSGLFKILEEIHTQENQGDQVLRSALASLFENNPHPLEVMKWKEIYETAEIAIDKCETVANIVEGILVKYG